MMKKLLSLVCGLGLLFCANAQTESHIDADDILFWVGEGESQAILVVDFNTTALAWGYNFDEADGLTVEDMLNEIMDADPRFYSGWDENWDDALIFIERPQYQLSCTYTGFKVNDVLSSDAVDEVDLEDGMFVKFGASSGIWSTAIVAVTEKLNPVDATIDASDVTYWVGEGTNSAVIAINWSDPGVALAWGVRFNGSLTIRQLMHSLDSLDSRVTLSDDENSFSFDEGSLHFAFIEDSSNYLQFRLNDNGNLGWTDNVPNGAFLKVGESLFAEGVDSTYWDGIGWFPNYVVWTTPVQPVFEPLPNPLPVDATISADAINYWVGEGDNKAILVVNWPGSSLAWGYKFNTETVTLSTIMDDIKAADSRFDYSLDTNGYLADITFTEGNTNLSGAQYSYWEEHKNGIGGWGLSETVADGDLVLWADATEGSVVDRMFYAGYGFAPIYAYTRTITPVSAPGNDGIDNVASAKVQVYPNPANEVLNIAVNGEASEAVLYDMTGRRAAIATIEGNNAKIATSSLANGIYMLHIGNSVVKVAVRH